MTVRLINLGLPKSGTTTLEVALERAGWQVANHRLRKGQTTQEDDAGRFTAEILYDGHFLRGDPLWGIAGPQALCEVNALTPDLSLWPQCDFALIDTLRRLHPQVRFTATWRDPRDISDSMLRWTNLGTTRLPRGDIPGLPRGYGDTSLERAQWIEGHYAFLDHLFAGDHRFHLCDVAQPDAAERLGAFLNCDLPWWGRANENREFPQAGAA